MTVMVEPISMVPPVPVVILYYTVFILGEKDEYFLAFLFRSEQNFSTAFLLPTFCTARFFFPLNTLLPLQHSNNFGIFPLFSNFYLLFSNFQFLPSFHYFPTFTFFSVTSNSPISHLLQLFLPQQLLRSFREVSFFSSSSFHSF